jgi:patatin-like phospholipase/acyl hydrolase
VDGGLIANNPSLLAFFEARELYPNADIVLVSLGTGQLQNAIEYREAKDWGIVGWGKSLLDCMMTGSSDVVDHQLQQVMLATTGGSRYYRFTVKLENKSDDMDNVAPSNLENLRRMAREQIITARARELAACAAILTRPN